MQINNLVHFVILATGQEIVGERADSLGQSEVVRVAKPRMIAYQQTQDGIAVGPHPFVMVNPDGTYEFPNSAIALCNEVPENLAQLWLQSTTEIDLTSKMPVNPANQ